MIKDSRGRIKIVLLVRPDVFHALNLYNSNSRLQDNTVLLDWSTNESEYLFSKLFELSGIFFSSHQTNNVSPEEAWNHYYRDYRSDGKTFRRLLRFTFQKPRDVLTFIRLSRDISISSGYGDEDAFREDILSSPVFTRQFSDYLLGEVRNHAAFYMTQTDFTHYIKFFQYLGGKPRFTFSEFSSAFSSFSNWAKGEDIKAKEFYRDPEALLQFFYDVNVVGYSDALETGEGSFYHWSYRERSINNIAPKIKTTGTIIVNPGISKALDIGKSFSSPAKDQNRPRSKPPKRGYKGRRRK